MNISDSSSQNNIIANNRLSGNLTGAINDAGTSSIIHHNLGYINESSGSATIAGDGSTTSFNIAHDRDIVPDNVKITPTKGNMASSTYWVSTKDGANFTLDFAIEPADGDTLSFDWRAEAY